MIDQIRTVAWKEWKALGDQTGIRGVAGMAVLIAMVLLMGVGMPWMAGPEFFASPLTLIAYPFIGSSVAANPVIDSFAGEKERRTLETLLASPLDDRAILLGKMWVGLAAGFTVPMLLYGLALVTVNVQVWGSGFVLPPSWAVIGVAGMSAGMVGLVCSAGIVASMRASTVRQAAQSFGYGVFGLFVTPVIVATVLPTTFKTEAGSWLTQQDPVALVLFMVGALLALDTVFFWLALRSFRRGRLALE